MNKDRWQQIDTIIDQVLAVNSEEERTALIESKCGEDEQLRTDVLQLLDSIESSKDAWEHLLFSNQVLMADMTHGYISSKFSQDENIPDKLGLYTIKQRLGRGGMGDVFLAERSEADFHRKVALKVIRKEAESEEQVRRFLQERSILSFLNHPNIARLLDGGITEDDRPYLVMEYVDGIPITDYCRQKNCSLHERLTLFKQVCSAVQYAHSNFIVHRDLKPDNLLVAAEGKVKVLDFGIAKLLDRDLTHHTLMETQAGQRMLSLNYAAPEQITLEPVTSATDVYALGLLLFELLTDTKAFELSGKKLREAEQIIREQDPKRPSDLASGHSKNLQGDLDAIVMKALRKEPEQRYESPSRLLEDIERYQTKKPVHARKGTLKYRAGKFARRNKTVLAAATLFLIATFGFASYHVYQVNVERNLVQIEADKAQEVSDFLVGLFESSNPYQTMSTSITAQELLDQGIKDVSKLEERPALQAQMLDALGRAQLGLGNYSLGDSLINRGLSIRSTLNNPSDKDIAISLDSRSYSLHLKGNYAEAESLARSALVLNKSLFGDIHPKVGNSLHNLAFALKAQGEYSEAESLYNKALEIRRTTTDGANEDVASVLNNLGQLLTERGEYSAADSLHREALMMRQQIWGYNHPKTTQSINNLAQVLDGQEQYAEAESLYRKAIENNKETIGYKHPGTVGYINNLAVVVERQGNLDEAESLKREALNIRKEILGEDHPDVTTSMNNLGVLLRKKENYKEAVSVFQEVLERLSKQYGQNHPYVAFTTSNMADALTEGEQFAKADAAYSAALEIMKKAFHEKHPHVATVLERSARLQEKQHNYSIAEKRRFEALEIRKEEQGNHPNTSESLRELADNLISQERPDIAKNFYREALIMNREILDNNHWRIAAAMNDYGNALSLNKEYAKADSLLTKSYNILKEQFGDDDHKTKMALRRIKAHTERIK